MVLAHGTCGQRCRRRPEGAEGYFAGMARIFARSGYVTYVFNRIGYAGSDGYRRTMPRTMPINHAVPRSRS